MMELFFAPRRSLLATALWIGAWALPVAVDAQEPPEPPAPTIRQPEAAPVGEQPPAADEAVPAGEQPPAPDEAAPAGEQPAAGASTVDSLRFSFEGTPWREVIKWLAEESKLALHVQDLPTGSFTYSDPDTFTTDQAIERVNLFLLSQGYTLVRSGKLLSVINLGDPRSMQQLDALAKLVKSEDFSQYGAHDVVKCIFPLGDIDAADAAEELSSLKLMTTPVVFAKTNRLMVTDTVSKLRSVQAILAAFQPSELDNGTVMKNFNLQHVDAEDILVVARPHLGLATGEMIGIDVSISADLQGDNIFVTGVEDKVKLIEGLITSLDKPQQGLESGNSDAVLKSHQIEGGNVETVYNVLVTLLAGKGDSVRLSMDEKSNSVVALAPPDVQDDIAKTVAEVQGANWEFEVIPLKSVDPFFAVSLLEEMLDLPDPLLDDDDDQKTDPPKIDADPGNMRLYVRGKRHEIDQIKKIVAGLDGNEGDTEDDRIRLMPLRGSQGETILETVAKFWREDNPIVLFPSVDANEQQSTERVLSDESEKPVRKPEKRNVSIDTARFLTNNIRSQAPVIRCQFTPRGLLVQCDDAKALDIFEDQLRAIAGPSDSTPSPPVVFYLKYTKPDDAIRMLAEMLDGGEAAMEAEAGSLVNGFVSGTSGSLLGSLVTSRTGTVTLTAGTVTVTADSRLNRLIAQGTTSDIDLIEGYLKVIDKESSITSVETYGSSHLIELRNTKASEVAEVIREAYAGRIVSSKGAQANQPGTPQAGQRDGNSASKSSAKGDDRDSRSSDKKSSSKQQVSQNKGGSQATRDLEPKMTIAVHEPSNSLIVTAPINLFKEVEQLAKIVDARNEQTVRVVAPTNAAVVETLMQVLAEESGSRGSRTGSSPSSLRTPQATSSRPKSGKNGR